MIESLLIANRGEIARRIARTARRLGIRTIAVYSDADRDMPFVADADEAVWIGPAPARESYLRQENILDATRRTGAEAIHPGYGFLSENPDFADAVIAAGLVWVGAPPAAIRAMGLKDAAKARMLASGVPVTPGYLGEDQSVDRLQAEADDIGYPLLIKAVAGGGGKGMRRVDDAAEFASALASCKREAASSFGEDRVILEKYISSPRHIEVQIFGDVFGNVVHLFERDCSLQRRHQKIIEEAPAFGMDERTRKAVCQAAVKAAQAVDYVGAGTVEFIADGSEGLREDRIWFMEMNTRLQVEHPVTEAITGQDLVELQLRIASGEALPMRQGELAITGWAMEARLYAENPLNGFLPSTGVLTHLRLPDTLRVDSGFDEGNEVSAHYDPMMAKIISHGRNRVEAIQSLAGAVRAVEVWPVKTNAAFLNRILTHPDFVRGAVDTGFIETHAELIPSAEPDERVLQAAALAMLREDATDPWTAIEGFRLNADSDRHIRFQIAGKTHKVEVARRKAYGARAHEGVLFLDGAAWSFGPCMADHATIGAHGQEGAILAPMPGNVILVSISEGDRVARGQPLMVMEAMKMEMTLKAPFDGTVTALEVAEGQQVTEGILLAKIEGDG